MKKATGTANGKIIIIGDHAVVHDLLHGHLDDVRGEAGFLSHGLPSLSGGHLAP